MIIHTHKLQRTIKRTLLAMGIMLVLAIVGGVVYVYISGRSGSKPVQKQSDEAQVDNSPLPPPHQVAPDAVVGASIEYLATPVKAGDNSTVNVHTNAKADCTISVTYNKVPAKDSGLIKKTANVYGSVSWAWTVAPDTPAGKWPVRITCANTKKSAVVEGTLEVTK